MNQRRIPADYFYVTKDASDQWVKFSVLLDPAEGSPAKKLQDKHLGDRLPRAYVLALLALEPPPYNKPLVVCRQQRADPRRYEPFLIFPSIETVVVDGKVKDDLVLEPGLGSGDYLVLIVQAHPAGWLEKRKIKQYDCT